MIFLSHIHSHNTTCFIDVNVDMLFEIKFTIDNYTKILFFLCICQFVLCIPLLQLIEILCIIRFGFGLCPSASPCIFRGEISKAIYPTTQRGYLPSYIPTIFGLFLATFLFLRRHFYLTSFELKSLLIYLFTNGRVAHLSL